MLPTYFVLILLVTDSLDGELFSQETKDKVGKLLVLSDY